MLPLIKFEYNNNEYFVEYDNKKLKYYSIKNNKKNYNISKEERRIIDYVVNKVTPSKNIIKLMDFNFNNRQYKMYLDKKTGLRLFKPTPNNKDSITLNKVFNNMEEYVAYNIGERLPTPDNTPYFKRIIKIGSKIIVVFLLETALLATILTSPIMPTQLSHEAQDTFFGSSYSEREIKYTSSLSDEEYLSRITNAIKSNEHITEKEKEAMLSNPIVFIDNKESINIIYLEKILKNLRITYQKEKNGNVSAAYFNKKNYICFYGATCFEEVEPSTFYHEFSHVLTQYANNTNSFLTETVNTIFTTEYYAYDDNSYRGYINYTYALMEIIGSEPLKKFHNYSNTKFVTEPLYEIIPDRDKATKLLALLENYKRIYDGVIDDQIDIEEGKQELANLNKTIKSELNDYYQKKYGFGIENDLFMLYYLDQDSFNQIIMNSAKTSGIIPSAVDSEFNINSNVPIEYTYFNSNSTCPKCIHASTNISYTSSLNYEVGNRVIFGKDRYINNKEKQGIVKKYPHFFKSIDDVFARELITRDIVFNIGRGISYERALIEIIGTEPLKEYYDTGNGEAIIDALYKIIPDKEKAISLISKLNKYCSIESSYSEDDDEDTKLKYLSQMSAYAKEAGIYNEFNDYYYQKTGKEIKDDLIMLSCLNTMEFREKFKDTILSNKEKEKCLDCSAASLKNYFINPSDTVDVIVIKKEGGYYILNIDDSNRYQNDNNLIRNKHTNK